MAALKPHLDGTALRQVNHGRSSTSFQTIQNSPASKHLLRGVPNGARSTSGAEEGHVVAKAEWTQGEANPRFVVTSLKRSEAGARHLYEDISCARGDKSPPAPLVPRSSSPPADPPIPVANQLAL